MKNTQLFSQRNQDHKKVVHDTLEGNSFVMREVPINGSFNVEPCVNAFEEFRRENDFSSSMNIMDHNKPEMVIFIQEDNDESIKDLNVDKGVTQEGKCILEDCEFNNNRINGSNIQTMEIMTPNSNGSEYASQSFLIKDGMKSYECIKLMLEAEVEIESKEEVSTNYATKEISSKTLREVRHFDLMLIHFISLDRD
ncbi:hypothetical protein Lalb_Chr11g0071951 [Lupinus albus]|uniref:Uncharacterized protein n=1 Tax=Lupinus albus TaxID=3870 RepID=A0A6A4PT55_LUPAL|nr:hypothetical protein Lalb_Chr11g0071951 [Lupinus albus]